MALFQGEDMVDVTTPDGRTLSLPRSIVPASMLPQQQIATPGGAPPMGAPQPITPGAPFEAPPPISPPTPGAGIPSGPGKGLVEMGEPTVQSTAGTGIVEEGEPTVISAATLKKQQDAQARAAKTPQGKVAAASQAQSQAVANEGEALRNAADLEAAEQDVVADAFSERNTQLDKLAANRARDAQANSEAIDKKLGEVSAMKTKIANTKIDREHDSPVMAMIGMILAGLGTAINNTTYKRNDENPALKMFYTAIDRKVAKQEADLDLMGKVYGMTKEEVDMLKDKSKSKLEFHNAMIAGETEKAIRHIEEITARSASEKTKANAKVMIAQLQQRVSDKAMEATRWGLDYEQKDAHQKQQMNLGFSQLGESRRHNKAEEQLKREDMLFDYQKALAADRAKGDAETYKARMEAAKEVREFGVKGVDNDYLLLAPGRAKMEQAAKYEAEAADLEAKYKNDPMGAGIKGQRVELLRQKAAEMRGDARSFDVAKYRDSTTADATSKKYAAAQSMMDTVDEIKQLYDEEGRGVISRTQLQQKLQAKVGLLSVAAKDAWELGAWDKGSAALVSTIIGKDPTDGMDVGFLASQLGAQIGNDPEGFKKRLDAVTEKLDIDVRQQMIKNSTWDGKGDLFTRKKPAELNTPTDKASAALTQARSGVELTNNAEDVGVVGRTARAVGYPFSPSHKEEAENAQSLKYPGLSKDQEAPFEVILKDYKAGNKQAGDEIVAKVANTAAERPDLAVPLLHNLREQAPNLYTAARAALPKGSDADKQMLYEESVATGPAMTPTTMLAASVINSMDKTGRVTDNDGYKELARRAGAKDPEARKALMSIVGKSNSAKLPAGSVFAGGQ